MRTTPVAIALGLLLLAGNLPAQVAVPRTVQVGGVRLEFLEWGKSGRTLILVPGSCDTAFIFGDLAPRLAHQFRVLSFTPRGCPGSGTATDGYGIDAQLRELVGFLDSHGIRRAVLAGHSSGGGKITRFARLYPSRVDGLVYFDTVYSFIAPGLEEGMSEAIVKQLPPTPERSLERFGAIEKAWERNVWSPALERNAALVFNHVRPDDWWKSFRADMEGGRYFETAIAVRALMFFAVRLDAERLKQFDANTQAALKPLVDQTEAKRREQIEAFRENGPHVRIVEMANTSHYCFAQEPESIATAIRAFIRQLP